MSTPQFARRMQAFAASRNLKASEVKPGQEFIAWINRHWTEYCATHKTVQGGNHAAFDAWLCKRYGVQAC